MKKIFRKPKPAPKATPAKKAAPKPVAPRPRKPVAKPQPERPDATRNTGQPSEETVDHKAVRKLASRKPRVK